MKILLFCEGQTERDGLPRFLLKCMDRLCPSSTTIGIDAINFRGVGNYQKEFANRAKVFLARPTRVLGILGLIDLHDLPVGARQYGVEKARLESKVNDPRFVQHFAVHETEAWILSDPAKLPSTIQPHLPQRLPEQVNFQRPPSAVLNGLYQRHLNRPYRKTTDGVNLLAKLDADVALRKCPYLKQLEKDLCTMIRRS